MNSVMEFESTNQGEKSRWTDAGLFLFLAGLFFYFCFTPWHGPAIGYEEIIEDGKRMLEVLKYGSSDAFFSIRISRTLRLPLFTNNPHNGALDSYLLLPFFFVTGKNFFSIRFSAFLFSTATLLFLVLFLKNFLNRQVAVLAALFLVFQPAFVL
ncbi:MAG TPA: hypothetical protein VJC03_04330, partial [bacterium]|nr:hypothetical protein [bacterium]